MSDKAISAKCFSCVGWPYLFLEQLCSGWLVALIQKKTIPKTCSIYMSFGIKSIFQGHFHLVIAALLCKWDTHCKIVGLNINYKLISPGSLVTVSSLHLVSSLIVAFEYYATEYFATVYTKKQHYRRDPLINWLWLSVQMCNMCQCARVHVGPQCSQWVQRKWRWKSTFVFFQFAFAWKLACFRERKTKVEKDMWRKMSLTLTILQTGENK